MEFRWEEYMHASASVLIPTVNYLLRKYFFHTYLPTLVALGDFGVGTNAVWYR